MKIFYALCVIFSVFLSTSGESIDFNPYDVLDVSQTASTTDIRKSYKKLVKEWHPDKNKSPNAEDKFIKIQQAYEILSDENKRDQYDTGGFSSDTVGQWRTYGDPTGFKYSDFDFFSNHGSTRTLSLHEYYSRVIPESHNAPHLIYVYSTFCPQCVVWLRTTWHKVANELETMGVVVYTVDTTFTSRIASSLGVTRIPTIVGMYKEKTHHFKGQINKEELKFFVGSFLPDNIITKVTSSNVDTFLSDIDIDDKPRVVLFSEKSTPTLLFRLMALKYQRYYRFGLVNIKDPDSVSVVKNFAVNQYGPTLLVFKDNSRKPAVVLGASEMPRGAVNDILAANKFVVMPRLTSQDVFDEICPPPEGAGQHVRLCMILVSDPSYEGHDIIYGNMKKLVQEEESKDENPSEWLKFMNIYTSKQPAFSRSLLSSDINQSKLVLLWRRGQTKTSLKELDIDFLRKSFAATKQGFQGCLRAALETAHFQRFQTTVNLSPLVDELAPFIVLRILQRCVAVLEYGYSFISYLNERTAMAAVVLTITIILWINTGEENKENENQSTHRSSNTLNEESDNSPNSTENNRTSSTEHTSSSNIPSSSKTITEKKEKPKGTFELLPRTYESSVLKQSQGHMTVILLVDSKADNKAFLLQQFYVGMKAFTWDPKITVTFLDVCTYSSWYKEIRRSSSPQPPDETRNPENMSSLHGNGDFDRLATNNQQNGESEEDTCGTVLALNGARHWYCIFVPRGINCNPVFQESRPLPKQGSPPPKQGSPPPKQGSPPPKGDTYADALSRWMDRVREGQMPKLYIRQWPGLYARDTGENDADDGFY